MLKKLPPDNKTSFVQIVGEVRDWKIDETRPRRYSRVEFTTHFNLLNFECWTENEKVFDQFLDNIERMKAEEKVLITGHFFLMNGHLTRLMVTDIQGRDTLES